MKKPFEPGDLVTTHFYPVQKNRTRTVIRCYRSIDCPSGWLVDTKDDKGKMLKALDAKWYKPIYSMDKMECPTDFSTEK